MYRIEIPKEIFENIFLQNGGEFKKQLTGEYVAEKPNIKEEEIVAEIEGGEFVMKPDGTIYKALGETHEEGGIEVTDEQLPEGSKIISDHLKVGNAYKDISKRYDIKVSSKDTYAKVLDKWTKEAGLQELIDEELVLLKKLEKQAKKLVENPQNEKTLGINIDFLQRELAEIAESKKPLEEARKEVFETVFNYQEDSKPKEENTQQEFEGGGVYNGDMVRQYAKQFGIDPEKAQQLVKKFQGGGNQERLNDYYNQIQGLGYTGAKQIGAMQEFMAANYPDEVVNYFTKSGQPMTAKHIDIIKEKYPNLFKDSGISPSKQSAQYSKEEKAKLQSALGENANQEFWLDGFQDNKWDWRFPTVSGYNTVNNNTTNPQQIVGSTPENNYHVPQDEQEVTAEEKERERLNLLLLPDQTPLMPSSLQGTLKATHRYDRLEAQRASPDAMIQEIRRQEQTAMQGLESLPDAQRAAAIAQVQANTQAELNKVMTNVEGLNMNARAQADTFNAQTQAQEENMRVNDLLSYEGRILKADDITQQNLRNYYNTNQKVNMANYNAVQGVNLLNSMYPNQAFTGNTVESTNLGYTSPYDGVTVPPTTTQLKEKQAEEAKERKKNKKKNGGRFKK